MLKKKTKKKRVAVSSNFSNIFKIKKFFFFLVNPENTQRSHQKDYGRSKI